VDWDIGSKAESVGLEAIAGAAQAASAMARNTRIARRAGRRDM
jgi:hypothetical protein